MKNVLMATLLTLAITSTVQAKVLTAQCENQNKTKSLVLESEIKNVTTPQTIKSLKVNGAAISKTRDISKMPIYQDGNIRLEIQFGQNLYSTAKLELSKCSDDFEASGKALVKEYVGGFAGTLPVDMTCTCSLK